MQSVLRGNVQLFWSRKSKNQEIQHGVGNCGEPLPPCMDLVCKNCPSKCLEFEKEKSKKKSRRRLFSFRKQPEAKEKPSNCKKEKPVEEKLTWWEMIFGPNPKRFWPDPCTCRLAHREKKRMRAYDARLRDPRYKVTAGDVFLYTEPIKRSRESCLEPQPKPPPAYKMPKAVLFKMISDVSEIALLNRMIVNREPCDDNRGTRSLSCRIPYEELRPPERRRTPFNCRLGIQSEDVPPPTNRNLNLSGILQQQSAQTSNLSQFEYFQDNRNELAENKCSSDQIIQKRSRIEQLKILVDQKDTSHCKLSPS